MWQREEPEVIDRCRPRRDFFVAQRITLPADAPGWRIRAEIQHGGQNCRNDRGIFGAIQPSFAGSSGKKAVIGTFSVNMGNLTEIFLA